MASELKLIKQDHNDQERREWVQRKRAEQSTTSTAVVLARCQCQCVCVQRAKMDQTLSLRPQGRGGVCVPCPVRKTKKKPPTKISKRKWYANPPSAVPASLNFALAFAPKCYIFILYFYYILSRPGPLSEGHANGLLP
jgi:hypothetical protein